MYISRKLLEAPNIVSVCIDASTDYDFTGCIYHRFSWDAINFRSLMHMLTILEEFYDSLQFPQSATLSRSFKRRTTMEHIQEKDTKIKTTEEVVTPRGERGTFIINVQYRQNSTWQGQVVWVDKDKTMNFRSALELLKLIDGALDLEDSESIVV